MATDYYTMGSGITSAFADGKEEARQRQRQVENDARTAKQFTDSQDELKYQRAQRQGVDDSVTAHQRLVADGVQGMGLPNPMPDGSTEAPGLRPASQIELAASMGKIAAARKDPAAMQGAHDQGRKALLEDIRAHGPAVWAALPDDQKAAFGTSVSKDNPSDVYMGGQDKAGNAVVTLGKLGDKGTTHLTLNPTELATMYTAAQLSKAGFGTEATATMMAGGASLKAIIEKHNSDTMAITKQKNDAQNKDVIAQARQLAAEAAYSKAVAYGLRVDAAADKSKIKEIPPELLERHNTLIEQLGEEIDPAKRKRLTTQVNALGTQIANALGKPRTLPAEREAKPVAPADIDNYIANRSAKEPGFKASSYDNQREAATAALNGTGGGGVKAVSVDNDSKDKLGTGLPTRRDPLSGQSLNEREWNKKFGRGDFKKDAGDGLPSMRPF